MPVAPPNEPAFLFHVAAVQTCGPSRLDVPALNKQGVAAAGRFADCSFVVGSKKRRQANGSLHSSGFVVTAYRLRGLALR